MTTVSAIRQIDHDINSQAINALRGYAILLVISMHLLSNVPTLVWPAKRLLLLGAYGVQLFFIASAVTLLMSWNREESKSIKFRIKKFFTNRIFRIAPLYFIAIIFYWFFNRMTVYDFSAKTLTATLFFYNAWSPYLIPTVDGWNPVPGGWSISVEFMFYLIFPFLAHFITTIKRAFIFFLIAYLIMLTGAFYGQLLYPEISANARTHFLFFWPPNQMIVFAIGFLLYRCIKSPAIIQLVSHCRIDAVSATVILGLFMLVIQFYDPADWPKISIFLPTHLLLSMLFSIWSLFMILMPVRLAVHNVVAEIGKTSFSIYLIHFATLAMTNRLLANIWPFSLEGSLSIPYAATLLIFAIFVSYQLSRFTYRFIEMPFVNFARLLSNKPSILEANSGNVRSASSSPLS
jgi:peptidoglycan/LPS O-acetylase OafA/YrhL